MSKDKRDLTLSLLRWVKRLAWGTIGLFFVALVHSNVGKWAEMNHWDNLLIRISGPPLSTFLGFLTSQHWFWFLSGLSVGIILGISSTKLLAKPTADRKATTAPTAKSLPTTSLQIDYKGIDGANKVETESDVFIRARVRNIGSETYKNARVFLTSLKEVHQSGVTTPTSLHDATPLPWAGWDFKPRDLPPSPDANHYVDLMRVSKHEPGWIICAQQVFADHDKLKRYRGTYRFHVALCADNAILTTCGVDVSYYGDWHNLRAVAAPISTISPSIRAGDSSSRTPEEGSGETHPG
jgi:hypothetical protein